MTDKEIFSKIETWCQCSKCKHKRTLSYKPIRNNEEEIVDFEDVRVACYKRTPFSEPSEVDGKIGLHSLPVQKEKCIFFEEREKNDIFDLVEYLNNNQKDTVSSVNMVESFYAEEAKECDNFFKNNDIKDILALIWDQQ